MDDDIKYLWVKADANSVTCLLNYMETYDHEKFKNLENDRFSLLQASLCCFKTDSKEYIKILKDKIPNISIDQRLEDVYGDMHKVFDVNKIFYETNAYDIAEWTSKKEAILLLGPSVIKETRLNKGNTCIYMYCKLNWLT